MNLRLPFIRVTIRRATIRATIRPFIRVQKSRKDKSCLLWLPLLARRHCRLAEVGPASATDTARVKVDYIVVVLLLITATATATAAAVAAAAAAPLLVLLG